MTQPAYNEYPITLAHPAFQPAKSIPIPGTEIRDSRGQIVRQDYQGTPQRFPPVTANDPSEEEYYKAQGYERAGKVDPSAWVRAHSDAPPIDYVPQKYPLWRGGVLIMTAQEDPEAGAEDLEPPQPSQPSSAATHTVTPEENARLAMEEMSRTMAAMTERLQAAEKEAADLRAAKEVDSARPQGRRGRAA